VAYGASGDVVFGGDWLGRVHRVDVNAKKVSAAVSLVGAQ
jgi:hypothetical protein